MIRADRAQGAQHRTESDQASSSGRSARRAVIWILALALAVFVLSYATSPKAPAKSERPPQAGDRMEVVPGQAGP